jgi:hypothetical protein
MLAQRGKPLFAKVLGEHISRGHLEKHGYGRPYDREVGLRTPVFEFVPKPSQDALMQSALSGPEQKFAGRGASFPCRIWQQAAQGVTRGKKSAHIVRISRFPRRQQYGSERRVPDSLPKRLPVRDDSVSFLGLRLEDDRFPPDADALEHPPYPAETFFVFGVRCL